VPRQGGSAGENRLRTEHERAGELRKLGLIARTVSAYSRDGESGRQRYSFFLVSAAVTALALGYIAHYEFGLSRQEIRTSAVVGAAVIAVKWPWNFSARNCATPTDRSGIRRKASRRWLAQAPWRIGWHGRMQWALRCRPRQGAGASPLDSRAPPALCADHRGGREIKKPLLRETGVPVLQGARDESLPPRNTRWGFARRNLESSEQ
jgi:hypothetical protein